MIPSKQKTTDPELIKMTVKINNKRFLALHKFHI